MVSNCVAKLHEHVCVLLLWKVNKQINNKNVAFQGRRQGQHEVLHGQHVFLWSVATGNGKGNGESAPGDS